MLIDVECKLRNVGPSVLPGMKVRFWWPVFGVGGMQLLSLPPKILVSMLLSVIICICFFVYPLVTKFVLSPSLPTLRAF